MRVHAEDVWHLALFTGTGLRTESNLAESGSAVLRHTYTRLQHMNKGDIGVMFYVTLDNSAGTKTPVSHI